MNIRIPVIVRVTQEHLQVITVNLIYIYILLVLIVIIICDNFANHTMNNIGS